MSDSQKTIFLCNGYPQTSDADNASLLKTLDYAKDNDDRNMTVEIPRYIRAFYHLPDRVVDLLEIAAYVYCADRSVFRGPKDMVEYSSWGREIELRIRVRDSAFWSQESVKKALKQTLDFMAGHKFTFCFCGGYSTPPSSLLDTSDFQVDVGEGSRVILFSGGLDSLSGIVQAAKKSNDPMFLISHRSQTGTYRTQKLLFEALKDLFRSVPFHHIAFECHLKGTHAREETQRTRFFLYAAVAYAASIALNRDEFFVYENGITSLNLPKSQQLMNARNSRTTHPRTITLLRRFLSTVRGEPFGIQNPFVLKTKAEVVTELIENGGDDLITSSVSCSRTYDYGVKDQRTHCGRCSQCIDRRMAMYAAGVDGYDNNKLYVHDLISENLGGSEAKTMLTDYIRQAFYFRRVGVDTFHDEMLDALTDIVPSLGDDESAIVEQIFDLCQRHGKNTYRAIERMRSTHEDLMLPYKENSLLFIVNRREYLDDSVSILADKLAEMFKKTLPLAFYHDAPKAESNLQDVVNATLESMRLDFEAEFPYTRFAHATSKPDQSLTGMDLWVEEKYIRGDNSPSKIADAIAADLTNYPSDVMVLFVVYDPTHRIPKDDKFKNDVEQKRRCNVCIVR